MAYTRKGTSAEVFSGSDNDVLVTPSALKGNVWFFDGNSPASEKDLGTNNDFDVPIIRNNVEKLRFDHVTWTTSSHTTNMKIGTNGNAGVVRFPYNSSVQHGIVSTTTGTLSFIIADGESSVATIVATPITIPSNGYVGIGATPSVPFDVTGAIRFRTFSTANNLLSVSDTNGNITSVSPSTIAAAANAYIQSGNSFGALAVLGTADNNSLSIVTNATEAIRINTSQQVGIGTNSPQSKLHLNSGILRQEQTSVISEYNVHANTDVDSAASEVVATADATTFAAGVFDYVIYDATKANMRSGSLWVVWNGTTVEYHEISTLDIGNTSGVTLSAARNGGTLEVSATVTTNNWTVKCISRVIT
jgi:hypothetical protein